MTAYSTEVDLNYHGTPKYPTGKSNYNELYRVGSSFSEQLSPIVTRILGQNPGKFTLQGTNTYFIGRSAPFILIDTGEGKPEYITQLREFFKSIGAKSSLISDIILTHKHQDHHGGLIDVLKEVEAYGGAIEKPRIHIHPLPTGTSDSTLDATISRLTETKYTPYNVTSPLYPLSNGTKIRTHDESAELEIVHTPGHTADSISLILYALHSDSPVPEGLFTADTVLGAGTAVFEDLSAYMTSLCHLVSLPIWSSDISIHPGHGPTVPPEKSKAHIETYISHREARENQILATLKGRMSIGQIVESIYADVPKTLWPAAAHGVGLHLRKLEAEGRVKRVGGGSVDLTAGDGTKMEQVGQAGISQVWELIEETKL